MKTLRQKLVKDIMSKGFSNRDANKLIDYSRKQEANELVDRFIDRSSLFTWAIYPIIFLNVIECHAKLFNRRNALNLC